MGAPSGAAGDAGLSRWKFGGDRCLLSTVANMLSLQSARSEISQGETVSLQSQLGGHHHAIQHQWAANGQPVSPGVQFDLRPRISTGHQHGAGSRVEGWRAPSGAEPRTGRIRHRGQMGVALLSSESELSPKSDGGKLTTGGKQTHTCGTIHEAASKCLSFAVFQRYSVSFAAREEARSHAERPDSDRGGR